MTQEPSAIAGTADLYDEYEERLQSCDLQLQQYGGLRHFSGPIATFRTDGDNQIVREFASEPGAGRVLVIDNAGSLHSAMVGDVLAARAAANGWSGVVVHGVVRDVAALREIPLGIKALGSNPRRSSKDGTGVRDEPVSFGGVTFTPGAFLLSDDDGIVVLPQTPTIRSVDR